MICKIINEYKRINLKLFKNLQEHNLKKYIVFFFLKVYKNVQNIWSISNIVEIVKYTGIIEKFTFFRLSLKI